MGASRRALFKSDSASSSSPRESKCSTSSGFVFAHGTFSPSRFSTASLSRLRARCGRLFTVPGKGR